MCEFVCVCSLCFTSIAINRPWMCSLADSADICCNNVSHLFHVHGVCVCLCMCDRLDFPETQTDSLILLSATFSLLLSLYIKGSSSMQPGLTAHFSPKLKHYQLEHLSSLPKVNLHIHVSLYTLMSPLNFTSRCI